MNTRYYTNVNVSGYEDAQTYEELVADTLQNTPAETEEEARRIVDEAIENGDLIEVLPEDVFNEETEKAYKSAAEQYSQDGNYIEVSVEAFGTRYWIGYDLKNGEWVPGELHQTEFAPDPHLCGCELSAVEEMVKGAAQNYMDDWEAGFNDAFRAAYVMDSNEHRMLGWRWDPTLNYLDVLYRMDDGLQETFLFDRDGNAVGKGEHLGGEDDLNDCYEVPSEAEGDGYQVTDELRRNWL